VALRERYRRCLIAPFQTVSHETRMVRDWILAQPRLVAIVDETRRAEPDLDHDAWMHDLSGRDLSWPSRTEAGRASLAWHFMNAVADHPNESRAVLDLAHGLSTGRGDLNDESRVMVELLYSPLFDYLVEQVGSESSALYTLDRFVRQVEWFDRHRLFEAYEADKTHGEEGYDTALRRFLFAEGVNMPFSQAKSPSGLSDVLADLDTEDPLICELKLFDADTHGKRHIAAGLHQAVLYAQDHGKNVAYLVVINLSGRPLELPTDGDAKAQPRHLDVAGVRVYILPIRALPPATSASKAGKANAVVITRDDLTNADAAD
jgi:hypothetical protein